MVLPQDMTTKRRLTPFLLGCLVGSSVHAATIYVDDACPGPGTGDGSIGNPYCLIQDAIDAAVSGADEVVVFPGDYFETIDFNRKAITLRTSGQAGVTTIDGADFGVLASCFNKAGNPPRTAGCPHF